MWLLLVCLAFIAGLLMLATMERVAKRLPPPDVNDPHNEERSAGPDGECSTADDITAPPQSGW